MRLLALCAALLGAAVAGCGGGSSSGAGAVPGNPPVATPTPSQPPVVGPLSAAFAPVGPVWATFGGKVNAFVSDGGNNLYVASGKGTGLETYSSAGIFRSADGGTTWHPSMTGLTDSSGLISSVINALWIYPRNPSVLLAGSEYDGIYRSIDGGANWTNVYPTSQVTQFALYNLKVFATTASGLLASADQGATWTTEFSSDQPTAIASAGGAMYAGTSAGNIYSYSNASGNDIWTLAGSLPFTPGTIGGTHAIHQLAIDPLRPSTVYASENDGPWDQDLHASLDGGHTWNTVLPGTAIENLGLGSQAIAFSTLFPHQLYVGSDGGLFLINGDGSVSPNPYGGAFVHVFDMRNIWVQQSLPNSPDETCWIASDQGLDYVPNCANPSNSTYPIDRVQNGMQTFLARDFAISPDGTSTVVTMQDYDAEAATFDGGRTWPGVNTSANQNFAEDGFTAFRPGNPKMCYEYDEYGLNISSDGCRSVPNPGPVQTSLAASRLMTDAMVFDPKNPLVMYFASSAPLEGAGFCCGINVSNGVFKSMDGGMSIAQVAWPFSNPGAIEIDPNDNTHIIVANMDGGIISSISVSFDGGNTWTRSSGVTPTGFWYSITISPAGGSTVLATNVDSGNNVFVLRSTDGGKSFVQAATVTHAPLTYGRADAMTLTNSRRTERVPRAQRPQVFVYSPVREILYNPGITTGTSYAVLTTRRGAYVSVDDGTTWQRVDTATVSHSFWRAHWHNGYLYLASDGQGVLASTNPLQLH